MPTLPDAIEQAIVSYKAAVVGAYSEAAPNQTDMVRAGKALRAAILAALNEQDAALRERAERLRKETASTWFENGIDGNDPESYRWNYLEPGDLADDLLAQEGPA